MIIDSHVHFTAINCDNKFDKLSDKMLFVFQGFGGE